jgi:hypothetical protein
MRLHGSIMLLAVAVGLCFGEGVAALAQQPTSEGHPHKWVVVDKSLADLVAEGFELKAVIYDTAETGAQAEPDVHYFVQKGAALMRCDFRKRGDASVYWCSQLTAAGKP